MKFKHKVLIFALIGLAVGIFDGTVVAAAVGTWTAADGVMHLCADEFIEFCGGNELFAFTIQAVLIGIYGVIPIGGAAFYSYEKWSLAKCTLIHYIATVVSYFSAGFFLRWFRIDDYVFNLIFFLCFTAAFFMIWLINYIGCKIELARVNRELKSLKTAAGEQAQ